jgi:hypothetical protein
MSEAKSGAIFEGSDPGYRFAHPRYDTRRMVGELPISPGQETKMPIWTKFALSVAIVLSTAVTASAATKSRKIAVPRSSPPAQAVVPRTAPFSNPYSAEATGGGNPGYNQRIHY